jgi:hypothetical protein
MDSSQKHAAISQLREARTREAREALLAIALGKYGNVHTEWAANSYVGSLEDKSSARGLLESPDPRIQLVAWPALMGQPIDSELLGKLKQSLQSTNGFLRRAAAAVVEQAPASTYSKECISALVKSIQTVEDAPTSRAEARLHNGAQTTQGGITYSYLVRALSNAKGADLSMLKTFMPELRGNARDCVLIASGRRGDATVRTDLRRIIRESPIRDLRFMALETFRFVGDVDDIPYLEEVAKTGALEEVPGPQTAAFLKRAGLPTDKYYPLRMAANDTVRAIRMKLNQEQVREEQKGRTSRKQE